MIARSRSSMGVRVRKGVEHLLDDSARQRPRQALGKLWSGDLGGGVVGQLSSLDLVGEEGADRRRLAGDGAAGIAAVVESGEIAADDLAIDAVPTAQAEVVAESGELSKVALIGSDRMGRQPPLGRETGQITGQRYPLPTPAGYGRSVGAFARAI